MFKSILLALMIPFIACTASIALEGLELTDLQHKILRGPDSDNEYFISVKLTVKNLETTERNVKIYVQALDVEEFEVFEISLEGTLKANETRVLSDTGWIDESVYRTIMLWQVEE